MNNKIVSTKSIITIFLAIVLVTGTIVIASSSFMIEVAQATSDREKDHDNENSYGNDRDDKSRDHDKDKDYDEDNKSHDKDRDDKSRDYTDDKTKFDYESIKYSEYTDKRYNSYKSDYKIDNDYKDNYGKDSYELQYPSYGKDDRDKSKKDSSSKNVNIKKIKCNNVNVNINDGQGSTGNGDNGNTINENGNTTDRFKKFNKDGSAFVCINDNSNVVVGGGEEPIPEEPIPEEPDLACEECFGANSTLQTAISDFLVEFDGIFTFGFGRGETLLIAPGTDTIEQLCAQIESSTKLYGDPLSDVFIEFVLSFIFEEEFAALEPGIDALIECLLEAGIIVEAEFPSIQISNNEIDDDSNGLIAGMKVDCSGDPMCKEIMRP